MLIQLLTQKMAAEGIGTIVTTGDADTCVMIVRCGLEKAISHPIVAITGQDVDLVLLLIALATSESNIYFMNPGKRKVAKLFSTKKFQKKPFPETILLLHAFIHWLRLNISYL
ncbi:hypothetical protein AVEN_65883-1 [Araneus ventricosus]|uniref:Uncharacterized protein n=1 Tax=Araneus ventricosus TaxID=182803 RepID=A0A4Y2HE77_ARAVE|nr:hypothetical protein AVEN_65883-1 [Araneus ventricosus]